MSAFSRYLIVDQSLVIRLMMHHEMMGKFITNPIDSLLSSQARPFSICVYSYRNSINAIMASWIFEVWETHRSREWFRFQQSIRPQRFSTLCGSDEDRCTPRFLAVLKRWGNRPSSDADSLDSSSYRSSWNL